MGGRFIFANSNGDVVVLAINGISSEYAIRNRSNVELPGHMLPKVGGDDTMPTMMPDSNEEQGSNVEPTAIGLEPRPSLKRKAATANLGDLELNLKNHCQD